MSCKSKVVRVGYQNDNRKDDLVAFLKENVQQNTLGPCQ